MFGFLFGKKKLKKRKGTYFTDKKTGKMYRVANGNLGDIRRVKIKRKKSFSWF